MKLIVGLGNPGAKYQNTRHNVGFMALDYYFQVTSSQLTNDKKTQSQLIKIDDVVFAKPQTYMNLSGIAVKKIKEFYKINQVMVIHDDLDLPIGAIRFKFAGSSGGHNGLKSIDEHITKDYLRLRIGIGHPNSLHSNNLDIKQINVINYVLEKFNNNELELLKSIFDTTNKAIESFIKNETLSSLQNKYTRKNVILE